MKNSKIQNLYKSFVVSLAVIVGALALPALAGPQVNAADCAKFGKDTSFKWGGSNCADTKGLFNTIVRFLSALVGVAVVGGIVWGGMKYATANGNASKTQEGVSIIVNAVIGLALYIFLLAITNFLVPGGVF
tara:strand:- start:555 stop:950 length:396 start_codon:yes stop_codon:yes gene_type:complete